METYSEVKNPKWANEEQTVIDCDVKFTNIGDEFVPFTANSLDVINPASKQIFDECVEGVYGNIEAYVPRPVPNQFSAAANKENAMYLLRETDWSVAPDVADSNLSSPYLVNQSDFTFYRSALRAIAVNPVEGEIEFPIKPEEVWAF